MLSSQQAYVDEILHRFAIDTTRPARALMVPNTRLDFTDGRADNEKRALMAQVPYRLAAGVLLYLAQGQTSCLRSRSSPAVRQCRQVPDAAPIGHQEALAPA